MGRYKFGKPNEEIELEDLQEKLAKSKLSKLKKAYIVLLYWFGYRRSEPLKLLKEDIEEKQNVLFISVHWNRDIPFSRAKRGQAGYSMKLPLSYFGAEWVKEVWHKTRKGRNVFGFSDDTGYRAVKTIFPHKTPHWLRHNRVTKVRRQIGSVKGKDGKIVSLDDAKSFTGIKSDKTMATYGMKTEEGIDRIVDLLD